ncbi:hypothetical protein HYS96_04670 [Candidatus Daviesbacteria bacterium]|nr:hypothetical protein [Candidatus Daviesbacteria bacterium]
MKYFFIIFSALLLIYMLWPGPTKISDLSPLPSSAKSTLSGDTVQIPNVSAYFSNNFRDFVVPFYTKNYQQNFLPFPPLRLNHPPEYSWTVIKKHTETTYLEELVYPLRDSLYVNGYEIFRPDGTPIFYSVPKLEEEGKEWQTKTTLRLYTSNIIVRIIVWAGILISMQKIFQLGKRIAKV